MIRVLPWDSEHFGFRIARADAPPLAASQVAAAVEEAERSGVRCLYLLAEAGAVEAWRAAAGCGFEPIDVRIEFEKQLPPQADAVAQLATEADRDGITSMARSIFTDSRFFRDERFPRDRSQEMFVRWANLGFDDRAHFNVVYRRDQRVVGFITCGIGIGRAGSIDLVGVAEDARGGGIGKALLVAAESELIRRGCNVAGVVTQGSNLGAQRVYERAGYVTRRVALWMHRWWS